MNFVCPAVTRASFGFALAALAAVWASGCRHDKAAVPAPTAAPMNAAPAAPAVLTLIESSPELAMHGRLAGRGPDFSPSVTKETWAELPEHSRRCSTQLLKAQLAAASADAPHADRSFRNCAIDTSRAHLKQQFAQFLLQMDANRPDLATEALGGAIATLHVFYAYSNYIELLAQEVPDWDQAAGERAAPWSDSPRELPSSYTLLSDYAAAAQPNRCPAGVFPSFNKRTPRTPAGARVITQWGLTAHEAAVRLALDDTKAMLAAAYKQRPAYGEQCGQSLVWGFLPDGWW